MSILGRNLNEPVTGHTSRKTSRPMASFREDARENRALQTNTAAGSASNAGVFSILTEAQKSDILSRRPGEYSAAAQITVTPQLQANLRNYETTRASLRGSVDSTPIPKRTAEEVKTEPVRPNPLSSTESSANDEVKKEEESYSEKSLSQLTKEREANNRSTGLASRRKEKYKKQPTLRYPRASIDSDTDYLRIEVFEYVAPGITDQKKVFESLSTARSKILTKDKKNLLRTILLPIPQNISDTNSVGWGEDSINGLQAYALGASANVINSGDFVKGIKDMFIQGADDFKALATSGEGERLAGAFFSSQAANVLGANTSFGGVLARSSGQIMNPNKELLFNGVNLRSFNFSFPLAPRNKEESQDVMDIIRTFKENMVPKKSTAEKVKGLFLITPNVFQLSYMTGSGEHKFLNKFILAAMTNMTVNYTGSGVYMTYNDGTKTPVHMVMNLSFQELNPVYLEDYNNVSEGVGY